MCAPAGLGLLDRPGEQSVGGEATHHDERAHQGDKPRRVFEVHDRVHQGDHQVDGQQQADQREHAPLSIRHEESPVRGALIPIRYNSHAESSIRIFTDVMNFSILTG